MSSTGVRTQVEANPLPAPESTSFQNGTGLERVAACQTQAESKQKLAVTQETLNFLNEFFCN